MALETSPETGRGHRKIHQSLYVGLGLLAVDGLTWATDLKIGILGHAFLIIGGAGLTGSSVAYIKDLNKIQIDDLPEQDHLL